MISLFEEIPNNILYNEGSANFSFLSIYSNIKLLFASSSYKILKKNFFSFSLYPFN